LSQVKDIFFDEFYEELGRAVNSIKSEDMKTEPPPRMVEALRNRWHLHEGAESPEPFSLVAVDGGVQHTEFSHGWSASIGRACAIVQSPNHKQPNIRKSVKIHLGRVFGRDKSYVPSYVRLTAEYDAALKGAQEVLKADGSPLVVMDGSLYLSRFPYAEREYVTHPELLTDLFQSIAQLHILSRDRGFPLVGLSKDSSVFYLFMALLRDILAQSDISQELKSLIRESTSPISLKEKMTRLRQEERTFLQSLTGGDSGLSDPQLTEASTNSCGFTHPLLLAPSIYYRGGDFLPSLYRRANELMPRDQAKSLVTALDSFFSRPTIALTYWKPRKESRSFRVDLSASSLGYRFPMKEFKLNTFISEECDLSVLKEVLNNLGFWFCNELEYNLPLSQADRLARFDSKLYKSQYEPFIVRRLQEHGIDLKSRVRDLREMSR